MKICKKCGLEKNISLFNKGRNECKECMAKYKKDYAMKNSDKIKKYNGKLNHGWDIDHIIPISSAESEDDIIKLNHYTNLQPLCSYINRVVKRDKINFTLLS